MNAVRYLSMDLDLPPAGTRAHTVLLQKNKKRLSQLLLQPRSPTVKIDYIKFKLMPIILATAAGSNLTLADIASSTGLSAKHFDEC